MNQKRRISLPKENGKVFEVETVQSLLLIGANGAGKTRLGTWIEIDSPQKKSCTSHICTKVISYAQNYKKKNAISQTDN